MTQKLFLSLDDCIKASYALADKVDIKSYKGIVAVLNGGLFPAYWLRKIYKEKGYSLPFRTIDVSSYENYTEQGALKIHDAPDMGDGAGWLVVDEICDTGQTFKVLRELYPAAKFVSLTVKQAGKAAVDEYALEFADEEWVVFPWEIE